MRDILPDTDNFNMPCPYMGGVVTGCLIGFGTRHGKYFARYR
ncbi:hypothetical protein [Microseira wollei]|nr:hypothetical protein [Microseira wollei]